MSLALNTKHLSSFINEEEYKAIYPQVEAAHKTLEAKNGPGSDFLGWMYLPRDYDKEEFERIKAAAAKIREDSDVLVVAGIGGSYLGARAVIEAVKGMYHNELDNGLKIYFCGNSISPTYLTYLQQLSSSYILHFNPYYPVIIHLSAILHISSQSSAESLSYTAHTFNPALCAARTPLRISSYTHVSDISIPADLATFL